MPRIYRYWSWWSGWYARRWGLKCKKRTWRGTVHCWTRSEICIQDEIWRWSCQSMDICVLSNSVWKGKSIGKWNRCIIILEWRKDSLNVQGWGKNYSWQQNSILKVFTILEENKVPRVHMRDQYKILMIDLN